jgi:hypothetical protein
VASELQALVEAKDAALRAATHAAAARAPHAAQRVPPGVAAHAPQGGAPDLLSAALARNEARCARCGERPSLSRFKISCLLADAACTQAGMTELRRQLASLSASSPRPPPPDGSLRACGDAAPARGASSADARVAAAAERAAAAEAVAAEAVAERDALRAALADAETELADADTLRLRLQEQARIRCVPLRCRPMPRAGRQLAAAVGAEQTPAPRVCVVLCMPRACFRPHSADAAAPPVMAACCCDAQDGVLLELLGATPAKAASSPLGAAWTRRLLAEQRCGGGAPPAFAGYAG